MCQFQMHAQLCEFVDDCRLKFVMNHNYCQAAGERRADGGLVGGPGGLLNRPTCTVNCTYVVLNFL